MPFEADKIEASVGFVPDSPKSGFVPDAPSGFVPDSPKKPDPKRFEFTPSSVGGNAAAVGDVILGIPAWAAKMGQTGITDVIAAAHGDPHPLQAGTEATEQDWQDERFLQAPLQTMFGYDPEKTVVGHLMGKVGGAVDRIAKRETERTGDPERGALIRQVSNVVMAKAGDLIIKGAKGAGKLSDVAKKRMAETTPTGAAPAPEWVTTKQPAPSTPVEGVLPPIEAYEPSAEAHQAIHEALSDPDLHTGHPEATEVAKDIAAEKVKDVVQADRFKQSGGANKAVLAYTGAIAGGAAAGATMDDDPIKGAFEGAGAGFVLSRVGHVLNDYGAGASLKSAIDVLKPSVDPMRKAAADVHFAKVANVKAYGRDIGAIQRIWKQAGISDERAAHMTHLYESGDLSSMTPKEAALMKKIGDAFAEMGTRGQQAGVLPNLIMKNFLPHFWDMGDAATKAAFDKLLESGANDAATAGTFTAHSLRRAIPSYSAGILLGLKPKTLNPAEILGLYANSVIKATENANALYTLKSMKMPNGHYAVEPLSKEMPKDYITDHKISGLEGFGVHPEMVDAIRRGFDDYRPGAIQKALLAVAFTSKRLAVSYSMFHPMSLLVAYTGAGGNPFNFAAGAAARGVEKLTGNRIKIPFKSAVDAARDQYLKAGHGDIPDFAIRNGLEIGTTLEETIGRDSFLKMTGAIDKVIGGDMHGLKPFTAADNAVHEFTWGYVHTGMKLDTFGREFERMLSDPKNAGKDVNQIAADAASYTNNIFGGLNWARVVEGMRSKFGRSMAQSAFSKHGLAVLQTGVFAPDWLMSTMRSWVQAVPGLGENAAVAKMHRAYIARSLLYTLAVTDALNLHYSGHHIWENDFRSARQQASDPEDKNRNVMDAIHDMTYIDMGDGTKVEGNKHLFEFAHAISDPAKFGMGKVSSIVSDPLNMAMNKQWLTPTWAPKISEGGTEVEKLSDYAKWFAKQHAPMSVNQLGGGSFGGTFGFPQTGVSFGKRKELRQQTKELKQERGLK